MLSIVQLDYGPYNIGEKAMRPVLEELDVDDAAKIVGAIIRRKKVTNMVELEESFRRSVESCHKSVKKVLNRAVKNLKKNGKVVQRHSMLSYKSQKA